MEKRTKAKQKSAKSRKNVTQSDVAQAVCLRCKERHCLNLLGAVAGALASFLGKTETTKYLLEKA
jgi:hypothetical protein